MQKDMHYFGTYAVARIAGFPSEMARIIATADEFVDEAVEASPISLGGQGYQLPVVSSHKMSELTKNFDEMDQWKVWVPFHFLPGGQGNTVDERLVCLWGEPGNKACDDIIKLALRAGAENKPYGLYLLGIVSHVVQDTYAHYGFSGMTSDLNEVKQESLKLVEAQSMGEHIKKKMIGFWDRLAAAFAGATKLGHAGAATLPDCPYLQWDLKHEEGKSIQAGYLKKIRNNPATFFMACTRLHAVFDAFLKGKQFVEVEGGHLGFSDQVSDAIQSIINKEGTKDQRCALWRKRIDSGVLFSPNSEDMKLNYNDTKWRIGIMEDNPLASTTDAYMFNRAAHVYLRKVQDEILPEMGILAG